MVKFSVEYEDKVEEFNGSGQLSKYMPTIKQRFGIEQGRRCQLKIKDEKKALDSKKQIQDQIESDAVLTLVAGKAVAKKRERAPNITFTITYGDETEEFEARDSAWVSQFVGKAKEEFGIDSKTRCQLQLHGSALNPKHTLAQTDVVDGSELTLVFKQEYVEKEEIQVNGFELTLSSIRSNLVCIPTRMDLYAILKKVSKNERQLSKKPLEFVLYIGTALDYLIRFDDHCKPKASNSRRTVFNKDEHEVVLIQRFTEDDFDTRFESPEHSALTCELLSDRLRENCSFVSNWTPGTGCPSYHSALLSKFNDDDVIELATQLIKVIREHD